MLFRHSLLHLLPFISFASFASFASSLPTESAHKALFRRNETDSSVYYGVGSTEHEERSRTLKAQGYRVASLSVFGTPPEVKYAAVWTRAEDADFETIATADEKTFNSWYESWKLKGYVSTHVSATGPAENAVFAGVMERANVTEVQKCSMEAPYAYLNATGSLNMIVKGVSVYGTPSNRRYCIVGHENIGNREQSEYYYTDTAITYQKAYDAEMQKRFWRPTYLDITNDHGISSIFEDSSVGRWVSRVGLTHAQLTAEIEAQTANGLSLVQLQGGGNDEDVVYAAIFAENTTPLPRHWNANGNITGFEDNISVASALDALMQSWMESNGISQAQVAIAREGKLLGERAFTLAEADRPKVQPSDKFLLASVTKMFTHAATQRLIDDGLLNLTTAVYPLLGYKPYDERANSITVEHLVHHTAGYDRDMSGDIGFMFRAVAQSKNSSIPATLRDMIEYTVDRPLDFTPGDRSAYSNYGTMLLSYIITNLTGIPYTDFLKERVLVDGLEAELFATAAEEHINDPVVQTTKHTSLSALFPQKEVLVPAVYGGGGDIKEEAVGSFGLRASASTIAKFIGKNAVWTIGGREQWYSRDGSLPGARAYAYSAGDFDWAVTLNSRDFVSDSEWYDLIYTRIPDVWYANQIQA